MINIPFLVVCYTVSHIIDWILQWDWQAINKSKWGLKDNKILSAAALLTHSVTYALCVVAICMIIGVLGDDKVGITLAYLFITHALIDNRWIVKKIMKFKGMKDSQVNDVVNFGWMHIGIDQRLHELSILLLSLFV